MKQLVMSLAVALLLSTTLHAGQSIITESDGYACMVNGKSRKDTESTAIAVARRKAAESVNSYIQTGTRIKDAMLVNSLLSAYANAQVNVLQELLGEWYTEQSLGDCYRVKLVVEVIPDVKAMARSTKKNMDVLESDPSCPLAIKVWMDKDVYIQGDLMKIFMKANKPFYANVVYKQADNSLLQLLPNHFRRQNYFNGGVVYEIPSGEDHFNMEAVTPFGFENVTVYASTSPTGSLDVTPAGRFFPIVNKRSDISRATRSVMFARKGTGQMVAEFAEATATAVTRSAASQ